MLQYIEMSFDKPTTGFNLLNKGNKTTYKLPCSDL